MSEIWARVALGAYRLSGVAMYPFMGPFLALRSHIGKEDRLRRYERYGYPGVDRPTGPLVWFHAASVGEAISIIPLIRHVDQLEVNTIMTTGTMTSAKVVASRLPQRTFHQYIPLDLKRAVKRFVDHWQPDLAIFAESEIWPTMIMELESRYIPQLLVNARMSDQSFYHWRAASKLAKTLFGNFSHVAAQSQVDADRFRILGARPVSVSGNLKADTGMLPCRMEELSQLKSRITHKSVWIAASTHPGEERIVANVHKKLTSNMPNVLSILVPRDPSRGNEIAKLLKRKGLQVSQRSLNQPLSANTDIYLCDTIGEMGLFLRLGDIAFIGRSMEAKGGQNPLESAWSETAILSGQHVHNFREVYARLLKAGGARLVRDENNLAANIEYLMKNSIQREKMIAAAHKTVLEMRGGLERTVEMLDAYIFPLTVRRELESIF